jgi:hypothetical protein
MKQDIKIEMNLSPYKGVWDNNLNKVIAPIYQEIIFDSDFSFNVILNNSSEIKHYFNTTWSENIDAATYKENENYAVVVKFYYQGQNSTFVEKCMGENSCSAH